MKINEEMLSAYLDGELSADDTTAFEAALAEDAGLQGELAALIEADQAAQDDFADLLAEPVPDALVALIAGAGSEDAGGDGPHVAATQAEPRELPPPSPPPVPANDPAPPSTSGWAIAAALAGALLVGGAGGYYFNASTPVETVAVAAWIEDIASYHAVYSQQVRHLAEVPAEEADHIETWLSATLGAEVAIPDLEAEGLQFEGARLLVAAGRPVAQLLYTDADGAVVALCQIQSDTPQTAEERNDLGGFSLVSWGGTHSNYVIVSDEGRPDLQAIVEAASDQV